MKQHIAKKNPLLQPLPLFAIISSTLATIIVGAITLFSVPRNTNPTIIKKTRYECENCGARTVFNHTIANQPDTTKDNSGNFHPVIQKIRYGRYRHIIETERLLLREVTVDDFDALHHLYTNPENAPSSTWKLHPSEQKTYKEINKIIENYRNGREAHWAICEKNTGKLIGLGGLFGYKPSDQRITVGWTFDSSAWGNGYGTELGQACVEYAMKFLRVNRVDAVVRIDNIASRKVLEKIGMSYSAHFRKYWRVKGELLNHYQFVILKKDIEQQLKNSKV